MLRDMEQLGDRTVSVNVDQLEKTLKLNRGIHRAEYEEAVEGYQTVAMERLRALETKAAARLKENFEKIFAKIEDFDPNDDEDDRLEDVVVLVQAQQFRLEVPVDHTESYDIALEMAQWETREEIELTQMQFRCYVMDKWDWRASFENVTKFYRNSNAR